MVVVVTGRWLRAEQGAEAQEAAWGGGGRTSRALGF